MKKKHILHVIIGAILATAFAAAFAHGAPKQQKGTGLPGTKTAAQAKPARKLSLKSVLNNFPHAIANGLTLVSDTGEYVTGKIYAGLQKFDQVIDEYVEGKPSSMLYYRRSFHC
jgi:hypothetical protein